MLHKLTDQDRHSYFVTILLLIERLIRIVSFNSKCTFNYIHSRQCNFHYYKYIQFDYNIKRIYLDLVKTGCIIDA